MWEIQEIVIKDKVIEMGKIKEGVDWQKQMMMEIQNFAVAMLTKMPVKRLSGGDAFVVGCRYLEG